jgi:formylglycine-generating enzyme required for sulfatase activity
MGRCERSEVSFRGGRRTARAAEGIVVANFSLPKSDGTPFRVSRKIATRLPTPREWEYAAHGWSNAKTGDYFSIQKRHFKIPFLDYPTTEEQQVLFEQGYSTVDQLIENPIGIHGMLGYAREWCTPIEKYKTEKRQGIKWEEYYTNYDNDIGYQTVTFKPQDQENIPFRVVLPCQK